MPTIGAWTGWCLQKAAMGWKREVHRRSRSLRSAGGVEGIFRSTEARFSVQTGVIVGQTGARAPCFSSPRVRGEDKAGPACSTSAGLPEFSPRLQLRGDFLLALPGSCEDRKPRGDGCCGGREQGGLMEELDHWIGLPETGVSHPLPGPLLVFFPLSRSLGQWERCCMLMRPSRLTGFGC